MMLPRFNWLALAGLMFSLGSTAPAATNAPSPARARLGINLSGPADWNTEYPFVDVFRFSRHWISQRPGAGWGRGPTLDCDPRGWPRRLEPECRA